MYKRQTVDSIIGVLQVRDLLKAVVTGRQTQLDHLISDCVFVHKTMKISALLAEFKAKKLHLAVDVYKRQVFNRFKEATGLELTEGFGQSETTVIIANFPWFPIKPGSTGKFSPLYDLDIVGEDGNSCLLYTSHPTWILPLLKVPS